MGLTLDFGMEKGNIACLKRGGEFPTAIGTPREPGFGDEAFWRSQVNLGPPNLATDEKDRGSVYVVTLPAFQRYLEDGPDAAPGADSHQQGTGDGHLEAHHDLQATPARPGKATRLGVRGSIVPAADFIFIIFEAGGRDLFSATEKNGADLTRHNLMIHPIPILCAYRYSTPFRYHTLTRERASGKKKARVLIRFSRGANEIALIGQITW
ncbi:hypothetical protein IEQ34_024807 [Dendrobium chrysotoxum]|uniref:Uncharacterized protein n=1 Tax=Dendrobium chrysotoxum TaxID=161865 RepID=A0AAV7FR84_DENCH|nr:hypothetical protein IEQ34_024807 [Dendrobium chrysotoxum]